MSTKKSKDAWVPYVLAAAIIAVALILWTPGNIRLFPSRPAPEGVLVGGGGGAQACAAAVEPAGNAPPSIGVVNRPYPYYANLGPGYGFYPSDLHTYQFGDVFPYWSFWNQGTKVPQSSDYFYYPYYLNLYPESYWYGGLNGTFGGKQWPWPKAGVQWQGQWGGTCGRKVQ